MLGAAASGLGRGGGAHEVAADALELGGGHLDLALVLGVRDAQVLGVDVHELELEVGDAVLVLRLEHESEVVGGVLLCSVVWWG